MKRVPLTLLLVFAWSLCFANVVKAATVQEFMGGYDPELLKWAAITSLLGGFLRTIFSLQSDARVVRQIAPEAAWDAGKALVAGMAAFILIQALRSWGYAIPSEVRFAAVLAAGVTREALLIFLRDFGKDFAAKWRARAIAKTFENFPPKDPT